jgi:hypothetical protein
MADQNTPNPQHLDDELARFTDSLLDDRDSEMLEATAQDQELSELQQTAVRLKRAFESDEPDKAMARRIRANLVKEWHDASPGARQGSGSLWQRWQRSLTLPRLASQQVYAFSAFIVIMVAGVLILVLSPDTSGGGNLPGSAGSLGELPPFVLPVTLVLGVALAGVVGWFVRQRRP